MVVPMVWPGVNDRPLSPIGPGVVGRPLEVRSSAGDHHIPRPLPSVGAGPRQRCSKCAGTSLLHLCTTGSGGHWSPAPPKTGACKGAYHGQGSEAMEAIIDPGTHTSFSVTMPLVC